MPQVRIITWKIHQTLVFNIMAQISLTYHKASPYCIIHFNIPDILANGNSWYTRFLLFPLTRYLGKIYFAKTTNICIAKWSMLCLSPWNKGTLQIGKSHMIWNTRLYTILHTVALWQYTPILSLFFFFLRGGDDWRGMYIHIHLVILTQLE